MNLSIRIEPRETYLYVFFTGPFDLRESKEPSLRFLDACGEFGSSKVLIDIRQIQGNPTLMERWDYTVFVADQYMNYLITGRIQNLRLAYLGSLPLIDPLKFGETVAINRGLNVKVTTDVEEAYGWLEVAPGTGPDAEGRYP